MIDGAFFSMLSEPPYTDPYVRWCEGEAGPVCPAPSSIDGRRAAETSVPMFVERA